MQFHGYFPFEQGLVVGAVQDIPASPESPHEQMWAVPQIPKSGSFI